MRTNIPLNHELRVFNIQADDFGDAKTNGAFTVLKSLVEDIQGFENSDHFDSVTGSLVAFIAPDDPFYVSKGGEMYGLVARFSRFATYDDNSWYRIASVRPGESLIGGGNDLVELTLTRISPRAAV
jgi:hypothetical protein